MNLIPILLAGFGGALGAVLRYLVSGIYPVWGDIPTGTLLVNFLGSTALSVITFGTNPNVLLSLLLCGEVLHT